MISGTIRSSVKLAMLDCQWQQKKTDSDMGRDRKQELSAEEQQLQLFQQQINEMRESEKPAMLDAKLESGAKLTAEEIEYLRKNNPQALKEYEELQQERANYRKQLQNCKSKEAAERLKLTKMGQYMASAKKISTNACIPKSKKLELMKKLLKQVNGIEAEHLKFTESLKYAKLPEGEKDKETTDAEKTKDADDLKEKLKEMTSAITVEGSAVDVFISENTSPGVAEGEEASLGSGIDIKV